MNINIKDLIKENKNLRRINRNLFKLAYNDSKFKCLNRNWLDENKKYYNDKNLYLGFIDVNNLKFTNDNYGHNKGDELIFSIVKKFNDISLKYNDNNMLLIRLGGDEFLVISNCKNNINQLEKSISKIASIGICEKMKSESFYHAMKRADQLMYKQKRKSKKLEIVHDDENKYMVC